MTLLTPAQARKEYNLGRDFVRRLIRDRKIPVVSLGPHKLLLPRDGLEAFLQKQTIPARREYFKSKFLSHTSQNKGVTGVGQSNYGR